VGLDGKNIMAVTNISVQICKLLMGIIEQYEANIANRVLLSELGDEGAKFLLKENFLTKGRDLKHYWNGDDDKNVEWYDHLNSFAYLSLSGLVEVSKDDLKTYDVNFSKIVEFLADEFDVSRSSRTKNNEHIESLLYFVGDARLSNKKMISVYFARRLSDPEVFKKVDEFFLKQSTTKLKKLILTSSPNIYPEITKTGASIVSISKLLEMANSKKLFNLDYIANVVFNKNNEDPKPYIHCTEDGSLLFIGEESWNVGGSKKRQIIKLMCDHYAADSKKKLKWDELLIEADIDESTTSRFRDMFKDSKIKELIANKDGYVWFADR
jgi:hypothetical protein